jgi:hypothetical protein
MKIFQQGQRPQGVAWRKVAVPLLAGAMLGCGPAVDATPPGTVSGPQGPCAAVIEQAPADVGNHAPQGSALTWSTNPPAAGTHYPVWAPWAQVFTETVPRGNWLHNAEHGGVVLLYRCAGACPQVAAGLQAVGSALAQDSACQAPINARWLLTPDPLLPDSVQVAAVTWGYFYHASCLDPDTLSAFIAAHYARAPEDFCSQGAIAWR